MDLEHEWPLLAFAEARRLQQPAVHSLAVGARDLERLRSGHVERLEERVVFISEPALCALCVDREHFVRVGGIGDDTGNARVIA